VLYEIRDYHYRPDIFEAYKAWAEKAVPVLRAKMDVLGFWIDAGLPPEITGTDPVDSPIGAANVTWIIRWESKAARDRGLKAAIDSDEWRAVWAEHPDANGYLQMSARFMDAM
jgi:hypothetical protein